jgi:hypothetical protein
LLSGDFRGSSLTFELVRAGAHLELAVPLDKNRKLQAEGIITRRPGEARSAYFTGSIGDTQVVRVPALELIGQGSLVYNASNAVDELIEAEGARIGKLPVLLRHAIWSLGAAAYFARKEPYSEDTGLLLAALDAQVRAFEAQDLVSRIRSRARKRQRIELRRRIEAARVSAQNLFDLLVVRGLHPGYDALISDDLEPRYLSWNTETGRSMAIAAAGSPVLGQWRPRKRGIA